MGQTLSEPVVEKVSRRISHFVLPIVPLPTLRCDASRSELSLSLGLGHDHVAWAGLPLPVSMLKITTDILLLLDQMELFPL
jgi:hypothetical protein